MHRLYELEPGEVSLVPLGAVQRKFLVLKSENGAQMDKKILDLLRKQPESMAKIEEIFKSEQGAAADEQTQTILKAMIRLLTPVKDTLSPVLLAEVLKAAGMKSKPADDDEDEEDEQDDDEDDKPAKAKKSKATCSKSAKTHVGKSEGENVTKEDISKSMAALPEEQRKVFEAILKSQEDQVKALVEKSQTQERELEVVRKASVKKEMIEKSQEAFKNLHSEDLVDTLLVIKAAAPEAYDNLEKKLVAWNEQIAKGSLFSEKGSALPGKSEHTWENFEAAAMAHIAKTGEKISKADAAVKFMETPEGRDMYRLHREEMERAARK